MYTELFPVLYYDCNGEYELCQCSFDGNNWTRGFMKCNTCCEASEHKNPVKRMECCLWTRKSLFTKRNLWYSVLQHPSFDYEELTVF